jgi:hypothetical protein
MAFLFAYNLEVIIRGDTEMKARYEIYKCDSNFNEIQEIYFKEVSVDREMMKIPSFYFTIDRNASTGLSAPKEGDYIKIIRNQAEILRGKIDDMEVRDESIFFEGESMARNWRRSSSITRTWRNVPSRDAINIYAQIAGFTLGEVESNTLYKHDYPYCPVVEELELFASIWDKEFYFDDLNMKVDFKNEIGTDRSADVRFIRGVNINTFKVKKSTADTWTKVIALGAGEGWNQKKVVVGTGEDVRTFTDKQLKNINDLTAFANKKLAEGNKPALVTYECRVESPLYYFTIGDKIWVEDSLNQIDEALRVMKIKMTFNETESVDVVLANRNKTMIDLFKRMEKGQRTLSNVHHSSAVQTGSIIQVDEDFLNPIKIEVTNTELQNTTTGNTIGVIENNVSTATTTANSAQADATNAQTTANTANATANDALQKANTAVADAGEANQLMADLSNDNKITSVEKQATKKEFDVIVAEKADIEAQGTNYGITTELTAYTNAYNSLNTYVTPLLADLAVTSDITGTEFRTKFKDYYDARTVLLKKVADEAKSLADTAQGRADDAMQEAQAKEAKFYKQATEPPHVEGRIWIHTGFTPNVMYRSEAGAWVKMTATQASDIEGVVDTQTFQDELAKKQSNIPMGTTAPTGAILNDLWLDTSSVPYVLKRHDGTTWQKASPTNANEIGAEALMPKTAGAPASPFNGQLWLDTSVTPNILKRYDGTTWIKATPTTASEVGSYDTSTIDTKVGTVDGKATDAKELAKQAMQHLTIKTPDMTSNVDFADYAHGLFITVDEDVHLGTAKVFAEVAGNFVAQLRLPNYNILEEKWYYLEVGENIISLDFNLEKTVGDYMLFGDATNSRTQRTLPAGVTFPYDSGTIHITGSTSSEGYWYHFYDINAGGIGVLGDIIGTVDGTDLRVIKSTAETAKDTADTAKTTAEGADSKAQTAQSTADSKAKTFTTTPAPPYKAGDIWKNGATTYICQTTRASGSYTASDWVKTGDVTASNTSADTAKVAGTTASTVVTNANKGANADADLDANVNFDRVNNKVTYSTGQGVDDLKPAQAGADVTGSNTSANTSNVGTKTATQLVGEVSTANSTANSAQADATNAQTTANTANATANTTKQKVDPAFTNVNGTYFVDGGMVLANSIGTNQLKANEVTAEKLNVGLGVQGASTGFDVLSLHNSATASGFSGDNPLRDYNGEDNNYASFGSGNSSDTGAEGSYFYVDLGLVKEVGALKLWFYSADGRKHWYKVKVSQDGTNWYYLIGNADNNSWVDSNPNFEIKYPTLVSFPPIKVRYIRIYGNGSSENTINNIHAMQIYNKMPVGSVSNSDGTVVINDSGIQVKPSAEDSATTTITKEGVSVKDGSFFLSQGDMQGANAVQAGNHRDYEMTDLVNESWDITASKPLRYTVEKQTNLIVDHSFEMIDVLEKGQTNATDNHWDLIGVQYDSYRHWEKVGTPKIYSVRNTDLPQWSAFGLQSAVTDSVNYLKQMFDVEGDEWYTVSYHVSDPMNLTKGMSQVYFKFWGDDVQVFGSTNYVNYDVPTTYYNQSQRHAFSFKVPAGMNNYVTKLCEIGFRSTVSGQWVEFDGIQVVRGRNATVYDPEDSLFSARMGDDKFPAINTYAPIKAGDFIVPNGHKMTSLNSTYMHMQKEDGSGYTNLALGTIYVTGQYTGTSGDIGYNTTQMVGYENLPAGKFARLQMRSIGITYGGGNYAYDSFTWNQGFASTCDSAWAQTHDAGSYTHYASLYSITRTGGTCYLKTMHDSSTYQSQILIWIWGIGD